MASVGAMEKSGRLVKESQEGTGKAKWGEGVRGRKVGHGGVASQGDRNRLCFFARTSKATFEVFNVAGLGKGITDRIGTLKEVVGDVIVRLVANGGRTGNVLWKELGSGFFAAAERSCALKV